MHSIDPIALRFAMAPFIVFILIMAGFIYFKNRKP